MWKKKYIHVGHSLPLSISIFLISQFLLLWSLESVVTLQSVIPYQTALYVIVDLAAFSSFSQHLPFLGVDSQVLELFSFKAWVGKVVVWMKMTSKTHMCLYIWMSGPQLVQLFEKDQQVWPCWAHKKLSFSLSLSLSLSVCMHIYMDYMWDLTYCCNAMSTCYHAPAIMVTDYPLNHSSKTQLNALYGSN